jgi:alkanesulfonate monooxygenase SsuD/methylene tetrahydromethanopterin reductase-like flavin-dependent oxidoreductase (luciferase family)
MQVSFQLEPQIGMTWPIWKEIIPRLESMGFADIFRSDHFTTGDAGQWEDSLELITSLAWAAEHTRRANIGSLVAPFSFRDPVMLVRQALAINDLSGGRMILGVGAGWNEVEHNAFGYDLGNKRARMDRLEEGLQVITALARGSASASFQGRYYRLEDAVLLPKPAQPLRILVGGKGKKRTLPLAARYADLWNGGSGSPQTFRELNDLLDQLLAAEGRQPSDLKRTLMIPVLAWRTPQDFERYFKQAGQAGPDEHPSVEEMTASLASWNAVSGRPDQVIEQMEKYAAAGIDTFVIQWLSATQFDGLDVIAEEVIPHFNRSKS